MFSSRLQQVAGRIEGTVALSLVAKDGIAVDSLRLEPGVDLELLTAELMSQVRAVSTTTRISPSARCARSPSPPTATC